VRHMQQSGNKYKYQKISTSGLDPGRIVRIGNSKDPQKGAV